MPWKNSDSFPFHIFMFRICIVNFNLHFLCIKMATKTDGLLAGLFLLLFSKCNCSEYLGLKFERRLSVPHIRSVVPVTISQCHSECLARTKCKSFNYFTNFHLCKLLEWDTLSHTLVVDSGCVYAEKRSWEKTTLSDECVSCTGVCELHANTNVSCTVSECAAPATVDRAHVLGNMRHVGAKILYECDSQSEPDPSVPVQEVTSVCRHDGTWSPISIKCRSKDKFSYVGCFIDKEKRIFPYYTVDQTLTTDKCYIYCKDTKKTQLFGTQVDHCFCGDSDYAKYGAASDSECNSECNGNVAQTCGGYWKMSVYQILR